jgi:hypothetical protein
MDAPSRTTTPNRFGFGKVAIGVTGAGGASLRDGLKRLRVAMAPYPCAAGEDSGALGPAAAVAAGGRGRADWGAGQGARDVRIIKVMRRAQASRSTRFSARSFLDIT